MTTYLLAGGGTAGHVNPLLALADLIRDSEPDSEIVVLGTEEGLESRLVPARGYELQTIARLPFPRKPSAYALKFPVKYLQSVRHVRSIIRSRQIDVVVGFGGYASAPAYRAAKIERVPSVVHEANAKPGLANKLGARSATRVAVTFANTPIKNARVTGMPLRPEVVSLNRDEMQEEARQQLGLDAKKPTLLVTGGSLGARAINEGILQSAHTITEAGVQVLHIWGGLTELKDPGVVDYHVLPYCDRMDLALAACTLAVSRAGSTTVSELSGLGIPAILVPYSYGNGEQRFNAREVVDAGGALMVEDAELTARWVSETLIPLINDAKQLSKMSERAQNVGKLDGTERLLDLVHEAIQSSS